MKIIARKPVQNDPEVERIVVDRGEDRSMSRFVSATATPKSLAAGEWINGHYFHTQEEAIQHFNSRRP